MGAVGHGRTTGAQATAQTRPARAAGRGSLARAAARCGAGAGRSRLARCPHGCAAQPRRRCDADTARTADAGAHGPTAYANHAGYSTSDRDAGQSRGNAHPAAKRRRRRSWRWWRWRGHTSRATADARGLRAAVHQRRQRWTIAGVFADRERGQRPADRHRAGVYHLSAGAHHRGDLDDGVVARRVRAVSARAGARQARRERRRRQRHIESQGRPGSRGRLR